MQQCSLTMVISGCAKFVDTRGVLKPSSVQANQIVFEKKSEHMGECSCVHKVLFGIYHEKNVLMHVCMVLLVTVHVQCIDAMYLMS